MSDYKELEDALSLVKTLCTTEQIQVLLRTRKGQENVRITAETKDELVDRNLRQAVEANAIEVEKVFDLIRSSEENGNQHIFYYKPKSKAIADALTLESIAKQLWGAKWKETVDGFPAIRLKPNDYRYSDFRQHPTKSKDWILKIYGHTLLTRFTGKIEQRGDNIFWKEYIEEPLRIVLLARWNSIGLLEIRVQRNESRGRIDSWQNKVWEMLSPALVRRQFDPWELKKPIAQLITKQSGNEKVYSFRDVDVIDTSGVHASFKTYEDNGNLFTSMETRESIQSYLGANSDCSGLAVTWLPQSTGTPQKELRTLLAAKERHEMIAVAHCSSKDLDYVTDQLRRFNKGAS